MESSDNFVVVFDAYGTLFDVHSVTALAETLFPGSGGEFSQTWRAKQLEYCFLRTMGGRYEDFWEVTRSALQYTAEKLQLNLASDSQDRLMAAYLSLAPFPESLAVLKSIRDLGGKLAILSNGNQTMLDHLVRNAGMEGLFTYVLSVDQIKKYKPDPQVYQMACDAFSLPARQINFVSSNGWDVSGAAWFGFSTFWVNRQSSPVERLGVAPHGMGRSLDDLLNHLRGGPL